MATGGVAEIYISNTFLSKEPAGTIKRRQSNLDDASPSRMMMMTVFTKFGLSLASFEALKK